MVLVDASGNETTRTVLIHHSTTKPDAPTVKASTTDPVNHPVLLTATQDQAAKLQYSLDDGATWHDYTNGVAKGVNGTVEFKAIDDYGNESEPTVVNVQNIQRGIAANPTAVLSAYDEATKAITVALGYDSPLTSQQQAITHLQYSEDGGQTWQTYAQPLKVTQTCTLQVRVVDDAGNTGAARTVEVVLPSATTAQTTGGNQQTTPASGDTTPATGTTGPAAGNTDPAIQPGTVLGGGTVSAPETGETTPTGGTKTAKKGGVASGAATWAQAQAESNQAKTSGKGWHLEAGATAKKHAASWQRTKTTAAGASQANATGKRLGILPQTGEQLLASLAIVGLTMIAVAGFGLVQKWGKKHEEN